MDGHGRSVDPATIGTSTRGNGGSHGEELPSLGQKDIKCSARKKKSLRARYAYGVVFLLTNIIAWLFRDYGERILPMLPCEFCICFCFHMLCRRENYTPHLLKIYYSPSVYTISVVASLFLLLFCFLGRGFWVYASMLRLLVLSSLHWESITLIEIFCP